MKKLLVPLVVGIALIVAAFQVFSAPPSSNDGVYPVISVTKRGEGLAPDFTWKQGGQVRSFADYTRGKVVLLNFWATWCGPCRRETPDLVSVSKEYANKNLIVIGVALDEADNALALIQNFTEKYSVPYIMIYDGQQKIAEQYGRIPSIPTTFIIDKNGKVAQKIVGIQSKIQFETAIRRVL